MLARLGVHWYPGKGKGSHGAFVGLSKQSRIRRAFTLPKSQQREVSRGYLNPLLRTFELSDDDLS